MYNFGKGCACFIDGAWYTVNRTCEVNRLLPKQLHSWNSGAEAEIFRFFLRRESAGMMTDDR